MFSSKKEKKQIGDVTYIFKKWTPLSCHKEGVKLGKALAPSITVIFDGMSNKEKQADIGIEENPYYLTEAATLLQDNLDDEDFEQLTLKLFKSVVADGEPLDTEEKINTHFEEYEENFYPVLVHSFKENLLDFFTKSDMFRSKLDVLKPFLTQLQEKSNEES